MNLLRLNPMGNYSNEEMLGALDVVTLTISKCEKMQLKFAVGTSQHTLLKNRIKAMYISKSLMTHEDVSSKYSADELIDAIRPVSSIISKCEKAQQKFIEGTSYHKRFQNIINAMNISKSLITEEISRRV